MTDKNKENEKVSKKINKQEGECPQKEGDNCLVPGAYNDSEPIGGA